MPKNFNQIARFTSIWFVVCVFVGALLTFWGAFNQIPNLGFAGAALIGAALIPVFTHQRVLFLGQTPQREKRILLVGIVMALFGLSLLSTSHQAAALVCFGSAWLFMHVAKKMKQRRNIGLS